MKMKHFILLIVLIVCNIVAFGQKSYYSGNKRNSLTEDTTTLVFKLKDRMLLKSFIKSKSSILIERYDTLNTGGLIEAKVKGGASWKTALAEIRKNKDIIYSWYLLKSKQDTLIPTGEILLRPVDGQKVEAILKKIGIEDKVKLSNINEIGVVSLLTDEENLFSFANAIYESKLVKWCHPNFHVTVRHTSIDPLYGDQWYLKNTGQFFGTAGIDINIENAWAITKGSSSIKIAVIDDGVENHEDINGRVLSGFTPRAQPNGLGRPLSDGDHGQACAGIIAATHDNSVGIAGIAPNCYIVPVNIFYGGETAADIAYAITWSWYIGQADVLSNSWSLQSHHDVVSDAISNARIHGRGGKGSIVVFASGNQYGNVAFPASVDGVVTVGAINNNGGIHGYSNTGASMDLVAPSGSSVSSPLSLNNPYDGIRTTDRMNANGYVSGNYVSFNGTSASCPQVAGVAALLLSVNPNLTESQARNILNTAASDMGAAGFDNIYGYGRLNACAAVTKALATSLSISGPTYLCDNAIYTIPNLPAGAIVTWGVEGWCAEVSSSSGNQATISRIDYGFFSVTATITTGCESVKIQTGQLTSGMPYAVSAQVACEEGCGGDYVLCTEPPNQDYIFANIMTYQLNAIPYPVKLHYMIINDTYPNIIFQDSLNVSGNGGYLYLPENLAPGYYGLVTWVSGGPCNESSEWYEVSFDVVSCSASSRMVVYPNPSNNELKISYSDTDKTRNIATSTSSIKGFSVKLLSKTGKVLKEGKTTQTTKDITLQVADLPNDTYYLHIYEGKKVTKRQVVIAH